ncbi:MAG: hypothetical protein OWQ51_06370 [Pyrobaculum arsenaticum]|nr:hypothetical protein [Pyrobaculum arsenaticum]MCY0890586.1 hypothetical protein [Pyrobaculum arsenaticum]
MVFNTDTSADLIRHLEDVGYSAGVIGRVKPGGGIVVDGVRIG